MKFLLTGVGVLGQSVLEIMKKYVTCGTEFKFGLIGVVSNNEAVDASLLKVNR